jgi:uncharacterized coiled-coil protein SlyX
VPWWPFNFGDNLSDQLVRIETKQDWIIKAFVDATAQSGAIDMSKLHDHLKQLADELDSKADHVIANETADETAFQDIITKMESTIDKLQKKLEDDASSGGSTGGGSGSGRRLAIKSLQCVFDGFEVVFCPVWRFGHAEIVNEGDGCVLDFLIPG